MRSGNNKDIQEEESIPFLTEGDAHRGRIKRRLDRRLVLLVVVAACLVLIACVLTIPCVYVLVLSPEQQDNSSSVVNCNSHCKLSIVESIPENITYQNTPISTISTYLAWMQLLQAAHTNVTISSYYWTLTGNKDINDVTDKQGSDIFNELKKTASRGVNIRVVQGPPSSTYPNTDSKVLADTKVIKLRSLNMTKLLGAGIIHTKMWIIDNKHFYIGSANMDWRALTQVKELGLLGMNCSCLANDAQKIFEVYWELSDGNKTTVPSKWPDNLTASFNIDNPAQLKVNGTMTKVFLGSSPPKLDTQDRTDDLTGLLKVINSAKKFIYIAVMDYIPATIYSVPHKYWPVIDDALKTAAYNRGVRVKVLGSYWNHTLTDMKYFMQSLGSLNNSIGQYQGSIETKFFVVPPVRNKTIPFTRVNHNKYMVTDDAAYIGTSNWSADYFTDTSGVSIVVNQTTTAMNTIKEQLKNIFERDWNSQYSKDISDL